MLQEPQTAAEVRERSRVVQRRLQQQRIVPKPVVVAPVEPEPEPDEICGPGETLVSVTPATGEQSSVAGEHPSICWHDHAAVYVQRAIARHFEVPVHMLLSPVRGYAIARPRQYGMFIARRLCGMGLSEIGRRFHRDHTSVLHACWITVRRAARDPWLAAKIEHVAREVAVELGREWDSAEFWDGESIRVNGHQLVCYTETNGATL